MFSAAYYPHRAIRDENFLKHTEDSNKEGQQQTFQPTIDRSGRRIERPRQLATRGALVCIPMRRAP